MGFSFKQMLTPPKSIRKFQPKKLGNLSYYKNLGKEVGIPALGAVSGLGALGVGGGLGGLAGKLGLGAGSKIGGLLSKGQGALGKVGQAAGALGIGGGGGNTLGMLLGGTEAILNARRGAESDKLRDLGVDQQKLQNKNRADLLGRALALDPNAGGPDLSSTFADPSNPFAVAPTPGPQPGLPPRRPKKRDDLLGRAARRTT